MTMRTVNHVFVALCISSLIACNNNKDKTTAETPAAESTETSGAPTSTPANQPKSYKATATPDSILLGKSSEALVKITGITAVSLSDPDGKDNGIELVVKLQATNKQQIGSGSSFSVSYSDSRLQLDNGTSIPAETGTDYLRAEPESTSKAESWTYEVPAGTKPTGLTLFMNGTRASTTIKLQ
jgi:hypothetical protein